IGRRQGADDELGRIFGPQHDIDLFAAQFVAHGSDARTAHTHAGADGIDALVVGDDGDLGAYAGVAGSGLRSEEHTSELQSLMRISYAVFCLKKKIKLYQ